jgi:Kef-type K+ transport system membrane component KefB
MDPIYRAIISVGILVFIAKIMAGIFSTAKLPPILGEVFAGIVFGPYALGQAIQIYGMPLVAINEYVDALAEIGAIMILFTAGLETGVTGLRKAGAWSILIAMGGAVPPFFAGYFLYRYLGAGEAAAMVVGAAMTATSIAITTKVLEDLGATGTDEANLLINAAVFDDVIGVMILSVVSSIAIQGVSFDVLGAVKLTAIFIVIWLLLLGAGVYILPKMVDQASYVKAEGAGEAAAIAAAFIMSAVAGVIGLSPIVGAYAAGVAVGEAKAVTHVKQFVHHITQIFSPLFFASMGSKVNLAIFNESVLLGIVVLTVVAFLTKALGSAVAALPKLRSTSRALLLGIGMVPRGELGFIVAALGIASGVIYQSQYVEIVGMVIATSFLAPIILSKLHRRSESRPSP